MQSTTLEIMTDGRGQAKEEKPTTFRMSEISQKPPDIDNRVSNVGEIAEQIQREDPKESLIAEGSKKSIDDQSYLANLGRRFGSSAGRAGYVILLTYPLIACQSYAGSGCPSIGSDYGSWTDLSGNERSTRHMGVDIAAQRGTPILSAAPGFVIYVDESTRGGKVVRIDHGKNNKTGENVFTTYAHLRGYGKGTKGKPLQYGDEIPRGHVVGYVGLTGETFEPHLHFQVNVNKSGVYGINKYGYLLWSDPVNPQPYWWQQNPGENKIHSYMVSMNYGDTGSSGFMGLTFPFPCNKK